MMGQMYSQDELAARDQALVARCCRWVKTEANRFVDGSIDGEAIADALWKQMGYEGALNTFEEVEKK